MDGHIVGSMISANSITGEQIQANSIKTANLELSVQKKIQDATNEETVKALIKADLDGFESTLSKEFVTVENATTQIQQATEVAVKEATQSIIDNAVSESMGAVDGQLNDKLNQYTGSTLLPAIAEKAEEVLQNAEDYVVTKLESYATKQELSSSISQTREQIELSVSEKYTTKAESATIITEAIDGITVGAINRVLGTSENKSFKFNGGANEIWLPYKFSNDISDKEVFVSFKYTLTGTAQNGSQIEFAPSYLKKTNNQTVYRPKHVFFTSDRLQDVNITDTVSFTTKDFQDISSSSTSYIRFVGNGFTGTLSVSEAQIKQGNSKTSWSPAPEDTITDITNAKNDAIGSANNTLIATIANYYTKSETDSAISVAKDEINLGVSNKYETKTNVETKISSTLSSAKSYADTKKTEAINSAASDATSKVNAAKSELNTAIGKKANSADVYTKTEVYTKSQTDSQIKATKDAINLNVSQTYETKTNVQTQINNIQVGGTNLFKGYAADEITLNNYQNTGSFTQFYNLAFNPADYVGKQFTISFYAKSPNGTTTLQLYNSNESPRYFRFYTTLDTALSTSWKYYTYTFTNTDSGSGYNPSNKIEVYAPNKTGVKVKKIKVELGNKATDWSPAPEDVDSSITSAITESKNYADSQIKIAKDSINLGVSQTYETKTNVTTKVNSAISTASNDATTKANNALSSAKSYADTKKTEAINSANNTLNTTIANYYTKSQTDSQINVAKNAITSSVSSTYATKTDVTSSINGVNSSISNLQNRMNSAEQKITDTAITNTVKKNFYTKEETNNQITSKGYQTSSQVQQTVDNLQIKFTESGGYNLLKNGKATLNTNFWVSNGGGIARATDSVYKTCFKTSLPSGIKYNGGDSGSAIRLKNNTHYVYEALVFSRTAISGTSTSPLHFWCGTTATTAGQSQCTVVDYQQAVPKINTWTKCYVHILTKASGEVWFTPFIYTGGSLTGDIWVTEISLSESAIQTPYSPHPSEIYDGLTQIDKNGITVSTSRGAYTQFSSEGMSSFNNSSQQTLGIKNGGITFHPYSSSQLGAYITQSALWGGSASANGLAISTANNGTYIALGTSSLSDANTTLNMDQALTISSNDNFQPKGINFWKDVHAHGYGIRQLSHLQLAGSGAIQFDYLNNSPSTIYEAVDSGHSLYVMGGYQMHLGCMAGTGTPKGMIWFKGQTDTHSYTHWDFHNYTMYNMKTASTYANYQTRRIGESYGVTSNVDGVRYVYRNVELVNGKAIRSIPLEYKGCEYDIVSIVCKGRGNAWVQDEDVDKFVIEGDCQSVNIEIIIHEIEQNLHTVALDEAYMEPLPQKTEPEIPSVITNVSPNTL